MQRITLYRYKRPDGGVSVSPTMPDTDHTVSYRLIADDGFGLTNDGMNYRLCVDADEPDTWREEPHQFGMYMG